MDAATAALEAARISVTGAIIVGALAMIGTIAGTVLAPALIRRSETKERELRERRAMLQATIPDMVRKAFLGARTGASVHEIADQAEAVTRFEVLLKADEWQLALIAQHGFLVPTSDPKGAKLISTAALVIAPWFRGELTPAEAATMFEERTGQPIRRFDTHTRESN